MTITLGQAEYVGNFVQDSPEWHQARGEVIGSSDIPIILGLSTFKSAYTLWFEKNGLITPEPPDEKQQLKLDYGHYMEPFVASIFQKKHPEYSVRETGTWRNIKRPWQGSNPDRHLALDGMKDSAPVTACLEVKTFPSVSDWEDGPTPGYRAQAIWQADTFGFPNGWIGGYANMSGDYLDFELILTKPGDHIEPASHQIIVDPFEVEAVRGAGLRFVESLTEGEPPEIDGSESTYCTLRRLNPSLERGKEAEIAAEIAEAYLAATAAAKAAESEHLRWKGHMLAHMGTAQYAVYNDRKIASRVAIKDGVPYLKEA